MAALVGHATHPVGSGALGASALSSEMLTLPLFWATLFFAVALLCVGLRRLDHARRNFCRPFLWGTGLPLAAVVIEPWFFRCPAPGLALLGLAAGTLAASARGLSATSPRETFADERSPGSVEGGAARERVARPPAAPGRVPPSVPALVAVGVVLIAALSIAWPEAAGDEPHYLIVAHSLWNDMELEVGDEYRDRDYATFHAAILSPHTKPGIEPGSRYSMHGVGYALWLLPFYALASGLPGAPVVGLSRLAQLLPYVLLGLGMGTLVGAVAGRRASGWGTASVLLLGPVLFAPLYLFPETLAMAASCAAFVGLRSSERPSRLWAAAVAIAVLPWLGAKYVPLAVGLAAIGIWRSDAACRRRVAVTLTMAVVVTMVAHGLYTWSLYGSWSPSAVYLGADPSIGRQPGYGARWGAYLADWPRALRTLAGFFVDQKEGLLAVAPHYLLAAAGTAALWRRARVDAIALLLVAALYLVPYAVSQQLGGQSPPARPAMAILWTFAPALGLAMVRPLGALGSALRGALVALSLCLTAAYAFAPRLLPHDYPVTASWLVRSLTPEGSDWWRGFPLWVSVHEPSWSVAWAWLALVVCVGLALVLVGRRCHEDGTSRHARISVVAAGTVGALAGALVLWSAATVVVSDRHEGAEVAPGLVAWVAASLPERAWAEPGGVWVYPGRAEEITLTSTDRITEIDVAIRTLVPAEVTLEYEGRRLRFVSSGGAAERHILQLGRGHAASGRRAWRLRLRATAGAAPADLEGGADRRVLGAFLQVRDVRRDPAAAVR